MENKKPIPLKVVFRYNKKFNYVEMFYYNEFKELVCFCLEECHSTASYNYYLSTKLINDPLKNDRVLKIINYYENGQDPIKLKIMKKLKRF